jgi:hypothetical protein
MCDEDHGGRFSDAGDRPAHARLNDVIRLLRIFLVELSAV